MADNSASSSNIPQTAKTHHAAVKAYLETYLQKEQSGAGVSAARQSAREKLTRLFAHQFEELSTDVYDEMNRRISEESIPFLSVQSDFHPKRNQARQKLATLSNNRFKDLASDVYHELERRYSLLKEPQIHSGINGTNGHQISIENSINNSISNSISNIAKSTSFNSITQPRPLSAAPLPPISQQASLSNLTNNQKDDAENKEERKIGASSEKDPFGVNFQTLDNLMADLGNMIATSLDEPKTEPNTRAKEATDEDRLFKPSNVNPVGTISVAPSYSKSMAPLTYANNHQIQGQMDELRKENDRLKGENKNMEDELQRVRADVGRMKNDLERTLRDLQISNSERERTDRENMAMINGLKKEAETLRKELSEMNAQKYLEEIEILSVRMKQVEAERDELKSRLGNYDSDVNGLREEISREKRTNAASKAEVEHYKSEIEILKRKIAELESAAVASPASIPQPISSDLILSTQHSNAAAPPATSLQSSISSSSIPSARALPHLVQQQQPEQDLGGLIKLDDRSLYSESGYIHKKYLEDFKQAVTELLRASKHDTPAAVLIAMKSIVVSTRSISDGIERFDNGKATEKASNLRSDISTHLTNLMTAAKNHATGTAGPNQIEICVGDLVDDVFSIINLVKIMKGLSMDKLKVFLEQQTDLIVQNIQILLQAMRQASFGPEFKSTISNITTVVDNLIQVSRVSLDETQHQERSDVIIGNLAESNGKLGDLGDGMMSEKKPSKQKLAAAAYEVAKYTKELVSLFDLDH